MKRWSTGWVVVMECDGARERSTQKLQEGEADSGEPRGWIKQCQVMGWQRRRDRFPTISGPLVLLLPQLELFPVCTASHCVKQNSVVETVEHFWSSMTLHLFVCQSDGIAVRD